uniref:Uncharacterized protein n=1 Tax=Candidatus Kentrum sp. DK TaxID=2126562 RepID=A0A450TES5_9GAMM|nr:MAG: hypothetical protein BECKDK2373B_GA0170837_11519 [Candidatus Kentron sp. DK]
MPYIYPTLPERYADLVKKYEETSIEDVLSNLEQWRDDFADARDSLSYKEEGKLWSYAARFIYSHDTARLLDGKSLILWFYLLDGCWAKWCRERPGKLVIGSTREWRGGRSL